jgi:t-SNARE complex subunit (syntaxin)
MMINYNESRKDLQIDKLHEDLVAELEAQASALEVTVDYYIAEFTNLSVDLKSKP